MNLNLKLNLKKEDLIKNKVLLIGIALGLASLWYAYNKIYKNTKRALDEMKVKIADESVNKDISERVAGAQMLVEGYKRYFAKEADVSWLIDRVSKAADESGLKIHSLNSKPLTKRDEFLYTIVNVNVAGTYHQLGDFVALLEGSNEFIRVERLSFKKDKEALSADLVIGTYFWK